MKKIYIKPSMKAIDMEFNMILAASDLSATYQSNPSIQNASARGRDLGDEFDEDDF